MKHDCFYSAYKDLRGLETISEGMFDAFDKEKQAKKARENKDQSERKEREDRRKTEERLIDEDDPLRVGPIRYPNRGQGR